MFIKLYLWLKKHLLGIDIRKPLEIAIANGLKIGKNHNIREEVIIDPSHCFLITIGDNVTIAPRAHILAHDASTKYHLGYTLIGRVTIGNNVFIGASAIIMPNVSIGDNVIIGAGSVVKHSIPANSVAVGNPATVKCSTEEYLEKRRQQMNNHPCYDDSYKINVITPEKKEQMINEVDSIGFII
ncbi:MAG: hypothetical protein IJ342_01445 [Muribaculaceae bacterium]|nr:hypothetical protein [Muribaculaceae bacterium]